MGKRLDYVDTARFLAIFFILVGHSSLRSGVSSVLFAFHVQLFFILYGYVHVKKDYAWKDVRGRCVKLFNRLMLPYFLLVFILGYSLTVNHFLRASYGTGWSLYYTNTAHLWFLPCYFLAATIFEILRAKIEYQGNGRWLRKIGLFVILICFGIFSWYYDFDRGNFVKIGSKVLYLTGFITSPPDNELYWGFPFSFNVALSGVIFMYIGTWLRKLSDHIRYPEKKQVVIPVFVGSLVLGLLSYWINQKYISPNFVYPIISMGAAVYGNYLFFLTTSVLLSITTISLSVIINNKLFSRIGKHTMEIYGFHMVLIVYTKAFVAKFNIPALGGVSSAIMLIAICALLVPIIDWAIPSLKGSSTNNKSE